MDFKVKFAFVEQRTKLTPFKQFLIGAKHFTKCYENVLKCYLGNYYSRKGLILCSDICKRLKVVTINIKARVLSVPDPWIRCF